MVENQNKVPFLFEGFYSAEFFLFYYCVKNLEHLFQRGDFEEIKMKKSSANYQLISSIFKNIFKIEKSKCDILKRQEFIKNIKNLHYFNLDSSRFKLIIQLYSKMEQPLETSFYPFELFIKGLILWYNKIRIFLLGSEKVDNFEQLQKLFFPCLKNLSLKCIYDKSEFLILPALNPEEIQNLKLKFNLTEVIQKNLTIYSIFEYLIIEFRKKINNATQTKEKFLFKLEYKSLMQDIILNFLNLYDFLKMKLVSKEFQKFINDSSETKFQNEIKRFQQLESNKAEEMTQIFKIRVKICSYCNINIMEKEKALNWMKEINQKVYKFNFMFIYFSQKRILILSKISKNRIQIWKSLSILLLYCLIFRIKLN